MQIIEIGTFGSFVDFARECGIRTIFKHNPGSGMPEEAEGAYLFPYQGFLFMFDGSSKNLKDFKDQGLTVVNAQVFPCHELGEFQKRFFKLDEPK